MFLEIFLLDYLIFKKKYRYKKIKNIVSKFYNIKNQNNEKEIKKKEFKKKSLKNSKRYKKNVIIKRFKNRKKL